ncbi:MAG: hypothetical protein V1716_02935 [Candidatus Uhrbacteria bacterium]
MIPHDRGESLVLKLKEAGELAGLSVEEELEKVVVVTEMLFVAVGFGEGKSG